MPSSNPPIFWGSRLCRVALSERFNHRFPWLVLALGVVIRMTYPVAYKQVVESEFGFIENATVAFLALTVFVSIRVYRARIGFPENWFGPFMLVFCAGAIYFAGEECSWGQHWFGWDTPEAIAEVNAQDETNLHNTRSWFNEIPRLVVELTMLVGLIWAFVRSRIVPNSECDDSWQAWLLPARACWSVALATVLVQYPERFGKLFPEATGASHWNFRLAEYQEFFFSIYLLTYVCSILYRLNEKDQADEVVTLPLRPAQFEDLQRAA